MIDPIRKTMPASTYSSLKSSTAAAMFSEKPSAVSWFGVTRLSRSATTLLLASARIPSV